VKKPIIYIILIAVVLLYFSFHLNDVNTSLFPSYVGSRACVCHATILQSWSTTGHSQIQQTPGPGTVAAGNWNST
jgi:hypothetical protein